MSCEHEERGIFLSPLFHAHHNKRVNQTNYINNGKKKHPAQCRTGCFKIIVKTISYHIRPLRSTAFFADATWNRIVFILFMVQV